MRMNQVDSRYGRCERIPGVVDRAVKTRNAVTPGLAALTLGQCPPTVEQDEEKKIWAQLDSIDIILNQAVSGQLTSP
jgi:hypothetical protein